MTNPERFGRGAFSAASAARACCEIANLLDDEMCEQLMTELHTRAAAGQETTIFDLHDATGIELARIFGVMRSMEHKRIVDIRDNASDAFGAKIGLRDDWQDQIPNRNAA